MIHIFSNFLSRSCFQTVVSSFHFLIYFLYGRWHELSRTFFQRRQFLIQNKGSGKKKAEKKKIDLRRIHLGTIFLFFPYIFTFSEGGELIGWNGEEANVWKGIQGAGWKSLFVSTVERLGEANIIYLEATKKEKKKFDKNFVKVIREAESYILVWNENEKWASNAAHV